MNMDMRASRSRKRSLGESLGETRTAGSPGSRDAAHPRPTFLRFSAGLSPKLSANADSADILSSILQYKVPDVPESLHAETLAAEWDTEATSSDDKHSTKDTSGRIIPSVSKNILQSILIPKN